MCVLLEKLVCELGRAGGGQAARPHVAKLGVIDSPGTPSRLVLDEIEPEESLSLAGPGVRERTSGKLPRWFVATGTACSIRPNGLGLRRTVFAGFELRSVPRESKHPPQASAANHAITTTRLDPRQ